MNNEYLIALPWQVKAITERSDCVIVDEGSLDIIQVIRSNKNVVNIFLLVNEHVLPKIKEMNLNSFVNITFVLPAAWKHNRELVKELNLVPSRLQPEFKHPLINAARELEKCNIESEINPIKTEAEFQTYIRLFYATTSDKIFNMTDDSGLIGKYTVKDEVKKFVISNFIFKYSLYNRDNNTTGLTIEKNSLINAVMIKNLMECPSATMNMIDIHFEDEIGNILIYEDKVILVGELTQVEIDYLTNNNVATCYFVHKGLVKSDSNISFKQLSL